MERGGETAGEEQESGGGGDYCIAVRGRLDEGWSEWLNGMAVTVDEGSSEPQTVLSGPVADQAALRGLLSRLWDLGLVIVSVVRIERVTANDHGRGPTGCA